MKVRLGYRGYYSHMIIVAQLDRSNSTHMLPLPFKNNGFVDTTMSVIKTEEEMTNFMSPLIQHVGTRYVYVFHFEASVEAIHNIPLCSHVVRCLRF